MVLKLAWLSVVLSVVIIIAILVYTIIGGIEHSLIYWRASIGVAFGLWWGIKEIKKAKQEGKDA